ncbi:MAG: hypothetical protein ACTSW1_17530 [Candidatus Hodarchaeales archaeon]
MANVILGTLSTTTIKGKKPSRVVNNKPPPKIKKKTPKKEKDPPITTILKITNKIPKTKIREKKPR